MLKEIIHNTEQFFATGIPPRPGVTSREKQLQWERMEEQENQRREVKAEATRKRLEMSGKIHDTEKELPGPKPDLRVLWAILVGALWVIALLL